jgi:hypothetical protein
VTEWLEETTDFPTAVGANGAGVSREKEPLPPVRHPQLGEPVDIYRYERASGDVAFIVCRFDPKDFRPAQPRASRWVWHLREGAPVLPYRLPELEQALVAGDTVWIVDGEKDADALAAAGVTATCCARSQGWTVELAEQLTGARRVRIVADRDGGTGERQARDLAKLLVDVAAIASVDVELVQAAEGKDAHDHLAAGRGLDEFEPLPEQQVGEQPFAIRVYSAPELAALELPQSAEAVTPHTRRAMITLLGGITGHGKSTWSAHEIRQAAENGARVLVIDLEQHLASVQRLIREAGLERSSAVDYAPIPEGLALNQRDDHLAAFETVLAGTPAYDLLVLDPFYKLHLADSNDELQARLLVALLRRWIAEHGFAILTATHCRKLPAGRTVITLDDFFGSSVFTRDPELIVGLQRHKDLSKLHIFKSREPDFQQGQVFELLFDRARGFYPKPTVDPEERAAEISAIGDAARDWITEHPGESTNQVKKAIAEALKVGGDKVEEALALQVKSGLLPERIKGSRGALLWYPLNHAGLTSPLPLTGEVTEAALHGQNRDDFTRPADLYVVETAGVGEVDETEVERLADIAREHE